MLHADSGTIHPLRDRLRLVGLVVLMLVAGFALRALAGPPVLPDGLPTAAQVGGVLSGAVLPLDALAHALVAIAWLLWLWVMGSLGLELLAVAAESAARGAAWARGLRRVADRISMPLARRAVAAAFAVQVLSRAAPVAAEPLPAAEHAWVFASEDHANPEQPARVPSSGYLVRSGDTLWSIAESAYGSGSHYRRLLDANVGRRMPNGDVFTAAGVIRPGWVLDVPEPSRWIEAHDGQRWYTVQPDDSLSSIAGRILGDPMRWSELFELNRGASTEDGNRSLVEPDLIWPGLRLRLPTEDAPATEIASEPIELTVAVSTRVVDEAVIEPAVLSAAFVEPPAKLSLPPLDPPPPLIRDVHPLPLIELDTAPPIADEAPTVPDQPDGLPIAPALGVLGAAAAAGVAAIGARRLRRMGASAQEPESEVVVEGGYAEAQLTQEFARQLQGGVALDGGSALAGQLLHVLGEYDLASLQPISLRHGRSSTTVTIAANLSDQGIVIDLSPILSTSLQCDIEASVSSDQDVVLRVTGARKTRLLSPGDGGPHSPPWFVPLGVLYDRQVFSAAWPAIGNLVVASLPGRGADTILSSLLATLTAHRSPHELRVCIVGRPRALPAPFDDLPHLDASIDPDDEEQLDGLLARLRSELDQRALGGAWPELLIVAPELTSLSARGADLRLLLGGAASSGVRLIAATNDPLATAQSPLLCSFTTRMVLQMESEEASVAILGNADAAFIGGGGRLMLRLDQREPVELYGYQVGSDHLERLVRVMRTAYLSGPTPAAEIDADDPLPGDSDVREVSIPSPESPIESDELPAEQSSEAPIQIYCFGAPRVLCMGQQVWPKPFVGEAKPWELLLYIACQSADGATREALGHALWPDDDVDDDLLMHRVRQLRYRLRHAFNEVPGAPGDDGICLERHGPPYLDPHTVHSDAQEFLELMRQVRIFPGPDSIARLERARALYAGDLLLGPDTRRYAWAVERDDSGVTLREHFRRLLQHATLTLADLYVQTNRIDDAIDLYRELGEFEPTDEKAWRALFQLHARRGDLPALIREERQMRAALRELAIRDGDAPNSISSEPSRDLDQEFQRLVASLEPVRPAASAG